MALISLLALAAVVAVILITKYIESSKKTNKNSYAAFRKLPGPKGLPFIGSVHELPSKCSWMKFHEWGLRYGPIYQVNLAGSNHVWISRDKIAHDLLSKRSAIYSDRPHIPALEYDNRMSGQYLPLQSNTSETWSRQRRFAKQIMSASESKKFHRYPELEAVRLLFELISSPAQYNVHLESFVARVTSRLAWGTAAPSEELKQRARELLIGVSPTGSFGNKLPAVMGLPEWMSGTKAWELRRGRTERKFFETMQEEVRRSVLGDGEAPAQSWMSIFLQNRASWGMTSDLEGAYSVGMHGIAGALTIAAPMQSFCLAMCHYPQYQPILHEEIDRVLGDRMPALDDMPDMPVLRAFIRETLRWRPPVPTGIPHQTTEDDVYEGYHIPKGSVIHPLEWSISRDPEVFFEPDEWNPMRWLEEKYPTYQEPLTKYPTITEYSQFGYGRRLCQGTGVAEADLFVGLGSVAWLFSIHKNGAEESEEQAKSQDEPEAEVLIPELSAEAEMSSHSRRSSGSFDAESRPTTSSGNASEQPRRQSHGSPPKVDLRGRLTTHSNDSAVSLASSLRSKFSLHANDSAISLANSLRDSFTFHSNASSSSIPGQYPGLVVQPDSAGPPTPVCTILEENLEVPDEAAVEEEADQLFADCEQYPAAEDMTPNLPGCWIQDSISSLDHVKTEIEPPKSLMPDYENDPTYNFSTLLIAKPLPFKFDLRIRNQERADSVARAWIEKKMCGGYEDPKVYWKGGVKGDAEHGWGETFA